ncbi:5-oxoprolinase subunit PxpB [Alteribacillus bidgolensis]|uniref:Sensor histidine kinase inhibitor, KipI family n=1 Tax=Alteribacillus bidgolensis TaxID=930129 RepID=A0A1G8K019_9BACI|nr:5-oxoprolinase subunit PxpB [Alteribacillus bidgolensis]SDI36768.1 sensor histidine kinase inhibitor, KipI family [Alteribacillus bidgolensis]
MHPIRMEAMGDSGLRVVFGTSISKKINQRIRAFSMLLEGNKINGISEWVPSYTAVTIHFDPALLTFDTLKKQVMQLCNDAKQIDIPPANVYEIPVCYGGEFGPDLVKVASHNQLEINEVIDLHTARDYLIYLLGFTPGFPYLGGMDETLSTPRLTTPRSLVKAGSVGIAGDQTGVYSLDSPGGWNIIGRSPVKLFDVTKESPVLLEAGHYIRFFSITDTMYEKIERQIKEGTYEVKMVKEEDV